MSKRHADRILVTVIGSDDHGPDCPLPPSALAAAEQVGRLVAQRGGVLITGGRGGIMEAASRGANLAGGMVVGLLPSHKKSEANPYVTVPLATGMDNMRNTLNVRTADAVIMVCGHEGTFHEAIVAYGRKPLIVLEGTGGWSDRMRQILYDGKHFDERASGEVLYVSTPEEAVNRAFDLAKTFKPKESLASAMMKEDPS